MRLLALLLLTTFMNACAQRAEDSPDGAALYPAGFFWEETFVHYQTQEGGEISSDGEFTSDELDPIGSEEKGRQVTKILSPTYLEALGKKGYLAQTLVQVDASSNKGYYDIRVEHPHGLPWIAERVFVEQEDWLLELPLFGSRNFSATGSNVSSGYYVSSPFADMEITKGKAVFPLHPEVGGIYTSDTAMVYEAVSDEPAFEQPAVKLSRLFPPQVQKLATFLDDCFWEDFSFGEKRLRLKSACKDFIFGYPGPQFKDEESSLWVGGKVRLKAVTKTETTSLHSICCNYSCEHLGWSYQQVYSFYSCDESDEIYFKGSRRVWSEEYEVTRVGTDADPKAQPRFEDMEVTP